MDIFFYPMLQRCCKQRPFGFGFMLSFQGFLSCLLYWKIVVASFLGKVTGLLGPLSLKWCHPPSKFQVCLICIKFWGFFWLSLLLVWQFDCMLLEHELCRWRCVPVLKGWLCLQDSLGADVLMLGPLRTVFFNYEPNPQCSAP